MPNYSEGRVLPSLSRADRKVANASKGHCTAFAILGESMGTRVQAESHLELCHLQLQNARPDVVDVREQVRFTYGRRNDRTHVFDIVVMTSCGERIAYTVKPEARLASCRFVDEMQSVAWWVEKRGFASSVRLLTDADVDRLELHNANQNVVLRDEDPSAEKAARDAFCGIRGAVSLKALTEMIGLEARGYRALHRMICRNEIKPLHRERITPETLVEWKGARV
jgi:hypothetical protein